MKSPTVIAASEFPHPLAVDKIPLSGLTEKLVANEHQCKALAERFGLVELSEFRAEFHARPSDAGRGIAVAGKITADVVQRCVVTLEPLPAHITADIDVVFAATGSEDLLDIEPDEEELEPIINGVIDLGELAAQHLGTALDPYPRKAGVAFVEAEFGDSGKRENPFIRLVELSKKPKDRD
jgi:uncharacterized metal-binding protein YceD (DUF177 family)